MRVLTKLGLKIGAIFLGVLAAMAVFGVLNGFAWGLIDESDRTLKLISVLTASAVAFTSSGWIAARLDRRKPIRASLAFGIATSLCSFGYILGFSWRVLPAVVFFGALAGLGGWLASGWRGTHAH